MSEDGIVEILRDRSVEATQKIKHNRSDVIVVDQEWTIVDFSVPWGRNVTSD